MTIPRIHLPGMTAEQWDEQRAMMGRPEMFPDNEWAEFVKKEEEHAKMTISDRDFHAAHVEIEAEPTSKEIEKAAKAIVKALGYDPEFVGYLSPNFELLRDPTHLYAQPLWVFAKDIAASALRAARI